MNEDYTGGTPGTQPDNEAPPQLPAASTVKEAEVSQTSENESDHNPSATVELRREFRSLEKWSLAVNVILAAVGIGALVVYNGQLSVMQGQLDQMRGSSAQTDKLIAEAAKQSKAAADGADAASKSFMTAKDQSEIMRDQLESIDRAWVQMVELSVLQGGLMFNWFSPTQPPKTQVVDIQVIPRLRNVGRSAATHVHVRMDLVIPRWTGDRDFEGAMQMALEASCDFKTYERQQGMTLFPGNDQPSSPTGWLTSEVRLTPEHLTQIAENVTVITPALVGCVDYRIGGSPRHHQTHFAYKLFRKKKSDAAFDSGQFFRLGVSISPDDLIVERDRTKDDAN